MKKVTYSLLLTMFLICTFMHSKAQDNSPDGFIFLKSIDQVEFYFKHSTCDDGEFLLIKAVNKGNESVSMTLQPSLISANGTQNSAKLVTIDLAANTEVIGSCNSTELKVNIYEFFSIYDEKAIKLDLTKN